ncbi:hypothetical protein HK097_005471, partial [Rhizophlyctis rosea]
MSDKRANTTPNGKRSLTKKPSSSGGGKPWIFGLRLFEGKGGKNDKERDAGLQAEDSPRTTSRRVTKAALNALDDSSDDEKSPVHSRVPTTLRRNSELNNKPATTPTSPVSKRASMSALLRSSTTRREPPPQITQTLDRRINQSPSRGAPSPTASGKRTPVNGKEITPKQRLPSGTKVTPNVLKPATPSKIPQTLHRRESGIPPSDEHQQEEKRIPHHIPPPTETTHTSPPPPDTKPLTSPSYSADQSLSSPEIPSSPLASESEFQYLPETEESPIRIPEPRRSEPLFGNDPGDMDKESFEQYLQMQMKSKRMMARTPPPTTNPPSRVDSVASVNHDSGRDVDVASVKESPGREDSVMDADHFPVEHRQPGQETEERTPSPIAGSPAEEEGYSEEMGEPRNVSMDDSIRQSIARENIARRSVGGRESEDMMRNASFSADQPIQPVRNASFSPDRPIQSAYDEPPHPTNEVGTRPVIARWETLLSASDHSSRADRQHTVLPNHTSPARPSFDHTHHTAPPHTSPIRQPIDHNLHAELTDLREDLRETRHAWLRAQEESDRYRAAAEETQDEVHRARMEAVAARREVEVLLGERARGKEEVKILRGKVE